MNSETRNCQNCKKEFTIEPEDFDFYKKIGVPAPTFCPECRLIRRLSVRNERNLYKRECGLCKKGMLSMYDPTGPFTVYCKDCWWGDGWDAMEYGQDYDFERPFFVQFRELLEKVPRPNLIVSNVNNCEYSNYVADGKNCYLCFGSIAVEDCMYGAPYESKNCIDTYLARECEYCYEVIDCEKLSNCSFVRDCASSLNLIHCFDCKNCQDCIGCVGLRNKKYHVFNESYSKEDYEIKKRELLSDGRNSLIEIVKQTERLKYSVPHRFAITLQSKDVSGDHIVQSKNARDSFDIKRCEDTKYCIRMIDGRDVHDTNYCEFMELSYDYIGFWKDSSVAFSNTCGESNNILYSDFCFASSNLFGCIALRKRSYCIFNKQYEKDKYNELVGKIKKHMNDLPYRDKHGRVYAFGEFFPLDLSPFAYNESLAQECFPLTQGQATKQGYIWKEEGKKDYKITIPTEELSISIKNVEDSIVKEVIGCLHKGGCNQQCTEAFKITPQELQFYRKMDIPLPVLCPNCRHFERLAKRNPFRLYRRQCQCDYKIYENTTKHNHHPKGRCPNEFETSYSPERKEIIYCEQCYNAEVV